MIKEDRLKLVEKLGLVEMAPREKKEWDDIYKARMRRIEQYEKEERLYER